MNDFTQIEQMIIVNEGHADTNTYLIYKMTENILYLYKQVDILVEQNKTTLVFPLLRQAYEYIILAFSISESLISTNSFFYPINNVGEQRDIVREATVALYNFVLKALGKEKKELMKSFLTVLKQSLNQHTHASFDRLSRFMMENMQDDRIALFLKKDVRILVDQINILLIPFLNSQYKTTYEIPNKDVFSSDYLASIVDIKDSISNVYSKMIKNESVKKYLNYKTEFLKEFKENYDEYIIVINDITKIK